MSTRSETNRANAQLSSGPRTVDNKTRSSKNSFRHGLYSQDLIIQGEDPAEFDRLRATLRDEHQPANTTEEILVDELAQHFWRMRRFRELEARAWSPENLDSWTANGLMTLIHRFANSAERSFHKSLTTLAKLQKDRGFVPQKSEQTCSHVEIVEIEDHSASAETAAADRSGFVPSKPIKLPNLAFGSFRKIRQSVASFRKSTKIQSTHVRPVGWIFAALRFLE